MFYDCVLGIHQILVVSAPGPLGLALLSVFSHQVPVGLARLGVCSAQVPLRHAEHSQTERTTNHIHYLPYVRG